VHLQDLKNILTSVPGKIILSCLLLCSLQSNAQNDPLLDSTKTIIEEVMDTTAAKDYQNSNNDYYPGTSFLKKEDYIGDTFSVRQRHIPDSLIKKMKEDDDFWYANAEIEKKKQQIPQQENPGKIKPYEPIGQRTWFQTLIWIVIVGGFAAFLIIYLSNNNIGLFRKKNQLTDAGIAEEMETEDIFAINYQKEIDKAAAQGNFRLAVRLMYLRLLKTMSEKNIIRYQQDKTNFDYLSEIHSTGYYNNFFRITRNYEYSWYGKFDVGEDAYGIIKKEISQFENGLR